MKQDQIKDSKKRGMVLTGWLFVLGLALAFLVYGLFMYFTVGDKGPPGWDFGDVPDTPGQSIYSTSPEPSGNSGEPAAQHISGKPSRAPESDRREEK